LEPDVEMLPKKEHSLVGEAGLMLSGGQRQRAGLARGLVRKPQLLLLDDVLSAVDHSTEKQLIATLQASDERPTTIIVAHRISALQHAEQIIVLERGMVRDVGTHDELRARPGFYRETWERQSELENDTAEKKRAAKNGASATRGERGEGGAA
ncbi:MAG: ABC transporter ATP-binding protein, partial [Myxococcales bacterium]|nr:ABC transporter ATP-binding protein [Myxococcales bacterium]